MSDDPKVSKLTLVERETTDVDEVLRYAMTVGLKTVVVIGMTEDDEFHFHAEATNQESLWLLKLAEQHLFESESE